MASGPSTPKTTKTPRTPGSTPRKPPHCSVCNQPRLGHPRGKCQPSLLNNVVSYGVEQEPQVTHVDIANAMGGLQIQPPTCVDPPAGVASEPVSALRRSPRKKSRDSDTAPRGTISAPRPALDSEAMDVVVDTHEMEVSHIRSPTRIEPPRVAPSPLTALRRSPRKKSETGKAPTLCSLNTEAKAALITLSQPGMLRNTLDDEDMDVLEHINKWLETVEPTPGRSIASSKQSFKDEDSKQSLCRTESWVERKAFLEMLADKSTRPVTSVFTIPMIEIAQVEAQAKKLKFQARVIAPKYKDGTTGDGWIVIGRDVGSVEAMFKKVAEDVKGNFPSILTTVGSGTAGAVATWMYLAFS